MAKFFSYTVFLIAISISLNAQDFRQGYIIKINGDSLPGFVEYPISSARVSTCTFKPSKKSSHEKYGPDELKAFGIIDDRRYESLRFSTNDTEQAAFFEALVKGTTSLYMRKGVFFILKDSTIRLPPPKQKTVEIKSKKYTQVEKEYISILNKLIKECNLTADKTQYLQRDITNLIQNYNRCVLSEGIVYKQVLPWTKLNYQLAAGFTNSNFKMEDYDQNAFSSNNSIFVGGTVEVGSPRLYDKLLFSIESFYAKYNYQGYSKVLSQEGNLRSDVFISSSFIKFPIGFRFNVLNEFSSPYIKGGVLFAWSLDSTVKTIDELERNGTITTTVRENKLDSFGHNGFWAAVGFHHVIRDQYKAFLELRYEKIGSEFLGTPTVTNNYNIILGIRF